jgi:hypothetical protein
MKDFGQGIFDMEFIHEMNSLSDLNEIKAKCMDKINSSSATETNKKKARAMVQLANTKTKLLMGMTNFSLSHQGLKTIR